jgi:anti-anti-sigma factor
MLQINTKKSASVAVLCLDGKIVCGETDSLRRAVLAQADASVIVLDLARVNTVDAAGLGVMLELREHSESRGTEMKLRNVTQLVRRILEITKLDAVFEISRSNPPAVAIQRQPPIFLKASPALSGS